ncbi:MAG TPA: VanZ family protein [Epsilonproteobacteria bacterium]|nr:VanZ family protein [Campylobacterota bacterium]
MKILFTFITRYWIILTSINLVLITLLSLSPLPELPEVPGTDKTHHFIAYAVLMFPTALTRPRYWQEIALLFILYSGLIELIQPYVNRYGEWLDLLANTTGILLAIVLAAIFRFFSPHNSR